jgi:Tol biopolymer transport system component
VGLEEARARTDAVLALPVDTVVFSADRTGNQEIYVMRADGSGVRRLTLDLSFDSWWARISPDRRRILFYRTPVGAPGQDYSQTSLWVMNADGSDQRLLRPTRTDGWDLQGHADWSPNGREIVMFGGPKQNTQLFVTDDEGRNLRAVTKRAGMSLDPSWSPDGQTLAFVGCAGSICFEKDYEVFTIAASGGDAKQLTSNGIRDHDPYFSPDGRRIAWIAETEPNAYKPGVGVWNIFVMNRDGTDQRNLTNDREISSVPRWSADGATLYFHRFEPLGKARWGIYRMGIDGSGLAEITDASLKNSEYPSL